MAIKRLRYFTGQFLKEQDFTDEQQYHLEVRRRYNKHAYSSGIVYGLGVTPGDGQVTIAPGMAIDPKGRELIVEAPLVITVTSIGEIAISYREEQTDPALTTDPIPGNTRWTETVVQTSTDPDRVVLAMVKTISPVVLDSTFPLTYSSPSIPGDLIVKGNLRVQGDTTVVKTEKTEGNVVLGNEDTDTVTIEGTLVTGHSSGRLQIGSPVDLAGPLTLSEGNPEEALHAVPKFYVDAHTAAPNPHTGSLAKAGDTMTGPLTLSGDPTADLHAASKQYVDARVAESTGSVAKTGDTMTGPLSITAAGTGLTVTGNVGIGTTTPGAPLHVASYMAVGPFAATGGVGGIDVSGPVAEIGFVRRSLTAWPAAPAAGDRFVWYNPDGSARLWSEVTGDLMTVRSNGNVGIGTTESGGKLTVSVPANSRGIESLGATSGNTHFPWLNNWNYISGNGVIFRDPSNTEKMRIDATTGNVGIGTTTPQTRLDIEGNLALSGVIVQDPWATPTLENGWVRYNTEYNAPGYFRDKQGIVHLRGLVRSGAINAPIFTLPAGYRPPDRELHCVQTNPNVAGRCDILENGQVWPVSGNNGWFSLDGITFRAGSGVFVGPILTVPIFPEPPIRLEPIDPIGPVRPGPIRPIVLQ